MIGFLRFFLISFLVLSVFYLILSMYLRSQARKRLIDDWAEAGHPGTEAEFVEAGLADYDGSLRRKLILGVYVLPYTVMFIIIYVTNFM